MTDREAIIGLVDTINKLTDIIESLGVRIERLEARYVDDSPRMLPRFVTRDYPCSCTLAKCVCGGQVQEDGEIR